MQLRIRTQPIESHTGCTSDLGFSVVVEDVDTGQIIPYIQKVTLEMDVENFATATIVVSGVQVESEIFVNEAVAAIVTRPVPDTVGSNGRIVLG